MVIQILFVNQIFLRTLKNPNKLLTVFLGVLFQILSTSLIVVLKETETQAEFTISYSHT